jgi:hypothetical protein
MRKTVKRLLGAGLLGGAAYAAWRAWNTRQSADGARLEWQPSPFPYPPVPRTNAAQATAAPAAASATAASDGASAASAQPNADGSCPVSHPIKAKLGSGIFHVPGGANYERTKPDRCYADESAAISDGLRRSKV